MAKFLAVYMGRPSGKGEMPDQATMAKGMAAWHKWMTDHAKSVTVNGGPLGKTKRIGRDGISDISNLMTGFTIIEADSHEAAAAMFRDHPHFTIFPGDSVEVMPCLPIPGGP